MTITSSDTPQFMAKKKSKKQIGLLLSSGSPLTPAQKAKLKGELHSGAVNVKGTRKKKARKKKG